MLGHIVQCKIVARVWSTFDRFFFINSKSQVQYLQSKLQEASKGSLSIDDYFLQMKEIVNPLYVIGEPITNDKLLMHNFGNLSHELDVLIVNS